MNEKRSTGAVVAGGVLICLGALALMDRIMEGTRWWGKMWPLLVIGFGAMCFVVMFLAGRNFAWMAIPGSIIGVNGVMMLFGSLTGDGGIWAYSWSVIILSVGLGIFVMGAWGGNPSQRRSGIKLMEIGAILFIIFGTFFEMLFSLGAPNNMREFVFPALLILLGVYLMVKPSRRYEKQAAVEEKTEPEIGSPEQ